MRIRNYASPYAFPLCHQGSLTHKSCNYNNYLLSQMASHSLYLRQSIAVSQFINAKSSFNAQNSCLQCRLQSCVGVALQSQTSLSKPFDPDKLLVHFFHNKTSFIINKKTSSDRVLFNAQVSQLPQFETPFYPAKKLRSGFVRAAHAPAGPAKARLSSIVDGSVDNQLLNLSSAESTSSYVIKKNITLAVKTLHQEGCFVVEMTLPEEGMVLHWAIDNWKLPNCEWWPPGSVSVNDSKAVETSFTQAQRHHWQVVMKFQEDKAPRAVVFVLRDKEGNWFNNNRFFSIPLKQLDVRDLVDQVVVPETTYSNWSLFSRFILASELLDSAEAVGAAGMAFIYTWLRFSANKQLAWYRNCNYQSKDIAHVQERLASLMTEKVRCGKDPSVRRFARLALATLPRGGGDSEQIRMGILNIMRDNGIREGHRPGLDEPFLEQWHQKLHTNTSPEDIHICEAYLEFLRTNSTDRYYQTLWNHGRITRDWLQSMDHPITSVPKHLPHLIPAFKCNVQHFLWVLKTVHSGADVDVALEMSKGFLNDDLKRRLYEICSNRDAWWVPGKIVEARKRLESVWRAERTSRDLVLLDISLDGFFGLGVARVDKTSLSGDDLCELIALTMENACIAAESDELSICLAYWSKVKNEPRWTREWALLAMAAVDRMSNALQGYMDEIYGLVQPHADAFGKLCGISESYIANFGEEVVRGQPLFNLSILLQRLQPMLRSTAGLGSWQISNLLTVEVEVCRLEKCKAEMYFRQLHHNQIVSHQAVASGTLMVVPSLASVQGSVFTFPRVILADSVGGMEDIAEGAVAVLSASTTDVLSHVAIRARNSGVLLASCFDEAEFISLKSLEGKNVVVTVDSSGKLLFTEKSEGGSAITKLDKEQRPCCSTSIAKMPIDVKTIEWVLAENDFKSGKVGGKAGNIAKLRKRVDDSKIELPPSVALPFGVFEKVMGDPLNASASLLLDNGLKRLEVSDVSDRVPTELAYIRELVKSEIHAPISLQEALTSAAESGGLIEKGAWMNQQLWEATWQSICHVWASKWTDRAWLSRRTERMSEDDLCMGCLLQKVVPAEYSFVVHTAHPITKDPSIMFCEVVAGLGEVLVGNYIGRALSFTITKDCKSRTQILSMPSKVVALYAHENTLIARSDSNGEDLESFAGAGLYESPIIHPPSEVVLDYSQERLLWDSQFREKLMQGIARVGMEVEAAFHGQPQDIEGVYRNDTFTVVQSRPQIL